MYHSYILLYIILVTSDTTTIDVLFSFGSVYPAPEPSAILTSLEHDVTFENLLFRSLLRRILSCFPDNTLLRKECVCVTLAPEDHNRIFD